MASLQRFDVVSNGRMINPESLIAVTVGQRLVGREALLLNHDGGGGGGGLCR